MYRLNSVKNIINYNKKKRVKMNNLLTLFRRIFINNLILTLLLLVYDNFIYEHMRVCLCPYLDCERYPNIRWSLEAISPSYITLLQ